ncbi:hypothetical protein L0337_41345 [candidate division KSB1 bacterium]|nr:hypothetical protein [candidate division KSB1 bacterium]
MQKALVLSMLALLFIMTIFMSNETVPVAIGNTQDMGSRLAKVFGIDRPLWVPNRIADYITNNGQLVSHIPARSAGMEWPAGSRNTINFASGLWLAGKKDGEIVTAAAEYRTEFQPGKVIGWSPGVAGMPANPQDPSFKVYIINERDATTPTGNSDYVNWPVQDGAPVDANGKPLLLGTSTAWAVFNDFDQALHDTLFKTKPMGVEVQMTAWAYDIPNDLGDMMFFKFEFINKSGKDVTDAYVAFWADVDIGDGVDLVGCDTTLSLGYQYKTQNDGLYGANPPAIGYDFLQGPIVPSPGDTANVSGRKMPGFRNLPMSAFIKYIGGGPRQFRDPETGAEAYNYLRGFDLFGDPVIDPLTGKPTKFWHAGDPVTRTGWVDDTHSDKRFLMSSGPFTIADGDTQEVVGGIVIAQDQTWQETVRLLKARDQHEQQLFDDNFVLPDSPSSLVVTASPDTASILLSWNNAVESFREIDQFNLDSLGNPTYYAFQGYNVYQLSAPAVSQLTKIKRIASFDVIDGVVQIRDNVFVQEIGETVERVVQDARDTGLQRYLRIASDALNGNTPLLRNREYYFAVTAYVYNRYGIPKTLEGLLQPLAVRPQNPPLGSKWTTPFGETLPVSHSGRSEGEVFPLVVDPAALTDHEYQVTFRTEPNGASVWEVTDLTAGTVKVSGWKNQAQQPNDGDADFPIVDGLLVKVFGPPEALNTVTFNRPDNERWFSGNNWGGEFINGSIGLGKKFFGSNIKPEQYVTAEIRFRTNADGQRAYTYLRGGSPDYQFVSYERQHFTVWDVTAQPPRQLNAAIVEQSGQQNGLWDPSFPGARNYLFILHSTYSGDLPDPYYTSRNLFSNAQEFDTMYLWWPILRAGFTAPAWQDGQVLTIRPNFVNTPNDVFTFKSKAPIKDDLKLARSQAAALVNVYPNPYRGFNIEETSSHNRFVTFTHLPANAKIQIYTLSGELVRTIEHLDSSAYERWDLRNSRRALVASGIYLARLDMGPVGVKVLKLVIFQSTESLDLF